MPGRRVGILADDQHPHAGQRPAERAQHVVTGRQIAPSGGDLGAQEPTQLGDRRRHRGQRLRPVRCDQLSQRARGQRRSPPRARRRSMPRGIRRAYSAAASSQAPRRRRTRPRRRTGRPAARPPPGRRSRRGRSTSRTRPRPCRSRPPAASPTAAAGAVPRNAAATPNTHSAMISTTDVRRERHDQDRHAGQQPAADHGRPTARPCRRTRPAGPSAIVWATAAQANAIPVQDAGRSSTSTTKHRDERGADPVPGPARRQVGQTGRLEPGVAQDRAERAGLGRVLGAASARSRRSSSSPTTPATTSVPA